MMQCSLIVLFTQVLNEVAQMELKEANERHVLQANKHSEEISNHSCQNEQLHKTLKTCFVEVSELTERNKQLTEEIFVLREQVCIQRCRSSRCKTCFCRVLTTYLHLYAF